jgi:glycosyltransferase involved in cell wall biosynthesis
MYTKETKIDVIIPVYNGSKFIIEALNSVINQTIRPNCIIVVDDGSSDNTENLILNYKKTSKINIEYIKKDNGGPNSARNLGLKNSDSEFVAFLDYDDTWVKDKLEKQLDKFNNSEFNNNLGLVYCDYFPINSKGHLDNEAHKVSIDKNIRGDCFNNLLNGNKIIGSASSVLIKRDVFNYVGLFDENLRFGEDWDMWLRISEKYAIDFVSNILVYIRRHEKNQTNNLSSVFLGEIKFFNKWVKLLGGKYDIPKSWADQIAFHIAIKIPRIKFIRHSIRIMDRGTKKAMFKKTFGSPIVYTLIFIVRSFFNPNIWKRIFKKI